MTTATTFTKVTQLGQLTDEVLIRELKKRIQDKLQCLRFVHRPLRQKIFRLEEKDLIKQLEDVKPLWKLLLEDAITFLKISDPREWERAHLGKRRSQAKMTSVKAFGVEDLYGYFDQFSEFERVLYGADEYYRGHVVHVLRVWLLGALLLDDILPTKARPVIDFCQYLLTKLAEAETIPKEGNFQKEIEKAKKAIGEVISDDEIQAMWCVIALTHDLGYPLQSTDKINESTRKMLRRYGKVNLQDINFDVPQEYHFINDFILKFISSRVVWNGELKQLIEHLLKERDRRDDSGLFRTHIQSKYYLKFSKSLMDYEHGIVSSILLMKNLIYFLESDFDIYPSKPLGYEDARQSSIRREILRAIASHTCDEIYYIRPNTLSFLLIMCDELQCWGRPTFTEMASGLGKDVAIAQLVKFSEREVEYVLKLPGDSESLHTHTRHMFRRLHKILRTALDAPKRQFRFLVTVRSKEATPADEYTFRFENEGFYWQENGKDWDIWEESKA
jgi:hypothetical protein